MFSVKISSDNKLKNYLENLRDHWGICIFIPAILGGTLQVFKLFSIEPSFVRFFAVEQVVPDGLLILFLLAICLVIFYIFNVNNSNHSSISLGWNPRNIALVILSDVFLIIFLAFLIYLTTTESKSIAITIIESTLAILILHSLFLICAKVNYLYFFKNKSNDDKISKIEKDEYYSKSTSIENPLKRMFLAFIAISIFTFFLLKLMYVYTELNKIKGLENEKILLEKVKKQFLINGELSIEYYNGKYIFIKIQKN